MRRTADAGVLIDVITTAVKQGPDAALASIRQRNLTDQLVETGGVIAARAGELSEGSPEERVGELLRFVVTVHDHDRTRCVLELISALWDCSAECELSLQRLQTLLGELEPRSYDLLDFDLRVAQVEALTATRSFAAAARKLEELADHLVTMGADERVELSYRRGAAYLMGEADEYAEARDRLEMIASRSAEQFGGSDLLSLDARLGAAIYDVFLGEHARAREELTNLITICDSALGAEHKISVGARTWLAANTSAAGEPGSAIEQAWLLLAESDLDEETIKFLEWVIGTALVDLMDSLRVPVGWREGGLVPTLQAAAAGEAEAFMRLPAELADIVRAARTQSAEPAPITP